MVAHGRIGRLVTGFCNDHALLITQPVLHTLEVVLAVVVVLIEDRDFGVGIVLQDVSGVNFALCLVVRLQAHGPWEVFRIAPFVSARVDEQMRNLLLVHVFVNRTVWRCSERGRQEQDLFLLNQFTRLLNRLGG